MDKWIAEHIYKIDVSTLCEHCRNKTTTGFTWDDYRYCRCSSLPIHNIPRYSTDLHLATKVLRKVAGDNHSLKYRIIDGIYTVAVYDNHNELLGTKEDTSLAMAICLIAKDIYEGGVDE